MHPHHHYMVHLPVAVHYMYMGVLHATSSPTLGIGPVINRALPPSKARSDGRYMQRRFLSGTPNGT